MGFLKKIIDYFSAKRYNRKIKGYLVFLDKELSVFKQIEFDNTIIEMSNKISLSRKYIDTLTFLSEQKERIEKHNFKVEDLKCKFDKIINDNAYNYILTNIFDYPIEKLQKYNEIALEINDYYIPDNFPQKKVYEQYMQGLGDIIDNYQIVIKQFSLVKEYKNILNSLKDEYIDSYKKTRILKPIHDLENNISSCSKKFYPLPVINENIIKSYNEQFIEKHLTDSVFDNVNGLSLDNDQRRAILCDPYSNLVIAGAGSGKTLTICGKVKYLTETLNYSPDDILLLSYSASSANDLSKKISRIGASFKVKTFHALGLEILNKANCKKYAIEEQFPAYIKQYFEKELANNPVMMNLIIQYFGLYLYKPDNDKTYQDDGELFEDLKRKNYTTLKDKLKSLKINSYETIRNEFVKSYEELIIANFLFINGVNYEYERSYEIDTSTPDKRQYTPDFYLSDYGIYLEHYGINKQFRAPQYDKQTEERYLEGINWKRATHKLNNTICIETYSYEFNDNTIFENLINRLKQHGIEIKPLSEEEINNAIQSIIQGIDFASFLNLIATFLNLYKSQYSDDKAFEMLSQKECPTLYSAERTKVFLMICKEVYNYYIKSIRIQNKIDFDDMILQATASLDDLLAYKYKYVIVDEFQDISQSRMKFLKKLIEHGSSKLFAVGDDWQSIYRFSGCDINIFLHFNDYFHDVEKNYIVSTHRNSQDLQNIVEPFITANPEQYIKHIKSDIRQELPVRLIYHNDNKLGAFNKVIKEISKINNHANILVLGRNRRDVDSLISDNIQVENYDRIYHDRYPNLNISYKTVHQSKGLEEDFVILISGENALNGFPNQMEDDPILDLVLSKKSDFLFAEERRLFYVALTRTRSIVYLLSDKTNQSAFIKEIKERIYIDNPDLLKENSGEKYLCPWCKSGRLILRESSEFNTFYGCSNYPYCKYTINDLKAVRTNLKCPSCGDFLTVRNGKNGKFIGCHNYPRCRYTSSLTETTDKQYLKKSIGFI